ncbi:MAG: YfhO family protein [bacterium]
MKDDHGDNRFRSNLLIIILFIIIIIIFFSQVIFSNKIFCYRDILTSVIPERFFARTQFSKFNLPLWNPYILCGYPSIANITYANFYPISLICNLLPFKDSINYFVIIHFFLAALCMYYFLKEIDLSELSCVIGAIVYAFCGYIFSTINLTNILGSYPWIPLILLFSYKTITRQRIIYALYTGIFLALQFLGGSPGITLMTISVIIFSCFYFVIMYTQNKDKLIKNLSYQLSLIIFMGVIMLLLIAFQFLPFLEMILNSSRIGAGLDYKTAMNYSFAPWQLVQFFFPTAFGNTKTFSSWGNIEGYMKTFYIGIIPCILSVTSFYNKRKKVFQVYLLFIAIIFLSISFGKFNPLNYFLFKYGGLKLIRYPVKFIAMVSFALAGLTAIGSDTLFCMEREIFIKTIKMTLLCLTGGIIFLALFFIGFDHYLITLIQKSAHYIQRNDFMFTSVTLFINNLVYINIILFLFVSLLYLTYIRKIKFITFKFIILIIIIFSLAKFHVNYPTTVDFDILKQKPEVMKMFHQSSAHDLFRMYTSHSFFSSLKTMKFYFKQGPYTPRSITMMKELFPINLSSLFNVYNLGGADSIQSLPIFKILKLIDDNPFQYKTLLDFLNVKYLLSLDRYDDIDNVDLKHIGVIKNSIHIYENLSYMPRAFIVKKARYFTDDTELFNSMLSGDINLRETVLIHSERKEHYNNGGDDIINQNSKSVSKKEKVDILEYSPQKIKISAVIHSHGFLVLLDSFYPGWKVIVNGKPGEILPANFSFKAVPLMPGNNEIEFVFRPLSFIWGSSISLLTIVILIILCIRKYFYCKYKDRKLIQPV